MLGGYFILPHPVDLDRNVHFSVFFSFRSSDDFYISCEHQTLCAQTLLSVLQQPFTLNPDNVTFDKVNIALCTICNFF